MRLKLYRVIYNVWNSSFSDLLLREEISIGINGEDAIGRLKEKIDRDARDFEAHEIAEVLGHRVIVT